MKSQFLALDGVSFQLKKIQLNYQLNKNGKTQLTYNRDLDLK